MAESDLTLAETWFSTCGNIKADSSFEPTLNLL